MVPSGGKTDDASNGKMKRVEDDKERPRARKTAKDRSLVLPLAIGGGAAYGIVPTLRKRRCGIFSVLQGPGGPAKDNQLIAAAPNANDKQLDKPAALPDNQPVAPPNQPVTPPNKKTDEKAPPISDTVPPEGKVYTPINKRFTIVIPPGNKSGQRTQIMTINKNKILVETSYSNVANGPTYEACSIGIPAKVMGTIPADQRFNTFRDAFLKVTQSKVVDEKDLMQGQLAGKDYQVEEKPWHACRCICKGDSFSVPSSRRRPKKK